MSANSELMPSQILSHILRAFIIKPLADSVLHQLLFWSSHNHRVNALKGDPSINTTGHLFFLILQGLYVLKTPTEAILYINLPLRIIFRVYSMPHWPVGRVSTVCVLQYLNPFIWGGDRRYIIHHPLGVANITRHTPERKREEGKIEEERFKGTVSRDFLLLVFFVNQWCTLSCEYLSEFSKKFETTLMV